MSPKGIFWTPRPDPVPPWYTILPWVPLNFEREPKHAGNRVPPMGLGLGVKDQEREKKGDLAMGLHKGWACGSPVSRAL